VGEVKDTNVFIKPLNEIPTSASKLTDYVNTATKDYEFNNYPTEYVNPDKDY
jgi:hypothetical protein